MRTIFKYTLEVIDEQTLDLPVGTRILTVQIQRGAVCLWAEHQIDPKPEREPRIIRIYGTGHPLPDVPGKYVGTVQESGGLLVWHVYDCGTVGGDHG